MATWPMTSAVTNAPFRDSIKCVMTGGVVCCSPFFTLASSVAVDVAQLWELSAKGVDEVDFLSPSSLKRERIWFLDFFCFFKEMKNRKKKEKPLDSASRLSKGAPPFFVLSFRDRLSLSPVRRLFPHPAR